MDFGALTLNAKIRIVIFFLIAGYLVFGGAVCVKEFRDLQLGQLTKDAANADITIDGADFSLFYIAGAGLVDFALITVTAVSYTLVMLVLSAVSALLLRAIGLRKSWDIAPAEYKLCSAGYAAMAVIGLIVSLILTRGRLLLAVALFELPSAVMVWLIYLLTLKRRSQPSEHGHFIDSTEQDLSQL